MVRKSFKISKTKFSQQTSSVPIKTSENLQIPINTRTTPRRTTVK